MADQSMNDVLSWIHIHPDNQETAQETIGDFLDDTGAVDELGFRRWQLQIGSSLFPGVSTQQTRLRYFFFVPWAYWKAIQVHSNSNTDIKQITNVVQKNILANDLVDALSNAGKGVIGTSSGDDLSLFPDQIYWNGLESYGFFDSNTSRDDLISCLFEMEQTSEEKVLHDEEQDGEVEIDDFPFDMDLFRVIQDQLSAKDQRKTFKLSDQEIDFLLEHIPKIDGVENIVNLLKPTIRLSYIARDPDHEQYEEARRIILKEPVVDEQEEEIKEDDIVRWPWEFARRANDTFDGQFVSKNLLESIKIVEDISNAMQGANIAYYWACATMLRKELDEFSQENKKNKTRSLQRHYQQAFYQWSNNRSDQLAESVKEFRRFKSSTNKKIDKRTKNILSSVIQQEGLDHEKKIIEKLRETESGAKSKQQARLTEENTENRMEWLENQDFPDEGKRNQEEIELDNLVQRLDFRWGQVRTFMWDILRGVPGDE